MAYDAENLARIADLEALAERADAEQAAVETRIAELEQAGGQPNVIEKIKVNGVEQTVTNKEVNLSVPTKVSQLTNDSKYQTEAQVAAKISSVYKPGGSLAFASLPTASKDVLGMVYNVTDSFTTTADFVEGAGKTHPAGTNVVVVQVDTAYKYDVLAGFVDLTGYVPKVSGKGLSTNDYTTAEKQKLAGVAEGANKYVHPTTAGNNHIPAGGSAGQILRWSADGTATWGADNNTTYNPATQSANGLMTAADKKKLDGMTIATDAEVAEMLDKVFGAR